MLIKNIIAFSILMVCGSMVPLVSCRDIFLNISFPELNITVNDYERFTINYNVTVYHTLSNFSLINLPIEPIVANEKVIHILNCNLSNIPVTIEATTHSGVCDIQAYRLGGTVLQFEIAQNFTYNVTEGSSQLKIIILHPVGAKEMIFRVVTIISVILMTFFIGCGLDPVAISDYVKKPVAPMIGFFSQFLVMPLIAFGLSQISNLEPAFGFGLITIGCSPGGGASNIWTALLHGDLNLSMTMTFLSSVAAMGMMPFWIFVFGRFFIDTSEVRIPYEMIAANLLQIVIPCCAGLFVRWKKENIAKKLTNCVRYCAIFFIVYVFSFGFYANFYVFRLMADYPYLLPIGASLPYLGFIFGFLAALASRRTKKECVTIALETGIQNIGIPILILLYSIPAPGGPLGAIMPIIVAVFTPMPLHIIFCVLLIVRKCRKQPDKETIDATDEEKEESKNKEKKSFIKSGDNASKKQTELELESI